MAEQTEILKSRDLSTCSQVLKFALARMLPDFVGGNDCFEGVDGNPADDGARQQLQQEAVNEPGGLYDKPARIILTSVSARWLNKDGLTSVCAKKMLRIDPCKLCFLSKIGLKQLLESEHFINWIQKIKELPYSPKSLGDLT